MTIKCLVHGLNEPCEKCEPKNRIGNDSPTAAEFAAADFNIDTERKLMAPVVAQWRARATHQNLKPKTKGYQLQQEAFFEGALRVMVVTGNMMRERANIVAFMVSVGRIDEMLAMWEGK